MGEIYYEITSNKKNLFSNLPDGYTNRQLVEKNKINQLICSKTNKNIRHGLFEVEDMEIYIVSYEKNVTNKILKKYFESCMFFIDDFIRMRNNLKEKDNQNFRRLKHNLITHNTNIIQELEKTFPLNEIPKGGHKQVSYIKDILNKNPDNSAFSILKVIKSSNLMKSDFDVYDMLNTKKPYVEFDNHNIHKIIILILNPFWLDLIEKDINIEISDSNAMVSIDYKSISVVFSHLFDNLSKYIAPDTKLKIDFKEEIYYVHIYLEMTSIKITDADMINIFKENLSGEYASKLGKSGDGIGMSIVKRLLDINRGEIIIHRNIESKSSYSIMSIPFERNRIEIKLIKSEKQ